MERFIPTGSEERKMAKEWAIQVVLERDEKVVVEKSRFKRVNVDLLVTEIFRYAGVVSIIKGREEGAKLVFNIKRAGEKGTEQWARMNSERIRSFGIEAVSTVVSL
jgi:hypothetical protein